MGVTSYVYDDHDRLSTENLKVNGEVIESTVYTYDDNGNLFSQTVDGNTTTYTWDDANRLIEAQTADGDVLSYEYDDDNIRVSSTVNGVRTTHLIDKNRPYAQVLEEYQDDTLTARYFHGLDLISVEKEGEVSLYLVDGLGSTRMLTDLNGEVVASYTYEAFGSLINSTGTVENDYLFAGEQFDGELGQYYLRDRYYDAGVGRFTRRDVYEGRLEEPITLHKYFYGNGNPVSYIDPSGLYTLSQFAAVGSIIGTLSGAFVGGYIGYTNNGNKMGWPVFAYSVAGALTGLVLGAQVGSLIGSLSGATSGLGSGGALGTTTKMTSKVVQQMSRIISSRSLIYSSSGRLKGYSSIAFTAGVISGGAVGTFTPNEYNDEVSVTALSTYTGGNALIIGYRWFQQTILNTRPSVPGGAELASAYITGFNLGYFAAVGVHRTIEKLD